MNNKNSYLLLLIGLLVIQALAKIQTKISLANQKGTLVKEKLAMIRVLQEPNLDEILPLTPAGRIGDSAKKKGRSGQADPMRELSNGIIGGFIGGLIATNPVIGGMLFSGPMGGLFGLVGLISIDDNTSSSLDSLIEEGKKISHEGKGQSNNKKEANFLKNANFAKSRHIENLVENVDLGGMI